MKFQYSVQDIRSFFTVGPKAKVPAASKTLSPAATKRKTIVVDSDSDDESRKKESLMSSGKANSGKKDAAKSKKRRIIESSDDEAKNQQKNKKPTLSSKVAKLFPAEKKLKPVTVSSVFGEGPIKRVEKERKPPKHACEKALLDNADDDDDLMEVDEALLSPKANKVETKPILKKEMSSEKLLKTKSKEKLETKSPAKEHHLSDSSNSLKSPSVKTEKATPAKESKGTKEAKHSSSALKDPTRSESNRSHTDSDDKESTKRKKNGSDTPSSSKKPPKRVSSPSEKLDTSGSCIFHMIFFSWLLPLLCFLVFFFSVYDPDQERHERKRAAAMLYQKFQKRAGPSNPGSKEIPQGTPTCLSGMTFVITGVLESMEKDEVAQVIKDFGGRVTSALSGKTTHIISGEDSGPAKLAKAEQMGIPILSEDDLLDLIREKSGLPTKKKKMGSPAEETKVEKKIKSEDVKVKKREKHESPQKKMKSPAKPVEIELDKEPSVSETKVKQEPTVVAKDEVALAWVDKYKPKTLKQIIGQQGPASNCEK